MLVKELISKLQKFDGDLSVQFDSGIDDEEVLEISFVEINMEPDKDGAVPGVFLMGGY